MPFDPTRWPEKAFESFVCSMISSKFMVESVAYDDRKEGGKGWSPMRKKGEVRGAIVEGREKKGVSIGQSGRRWGGKARSFKNDDRVTATSP